MNNDYFIKEFEKLQEHNPFVELSKRLIRVGTMNNGQPIYGLPPKRRLEEKSHKYIVKHGSVTHYANTLDELIQRLNINKNMLEKIRDGRTYGEYEVLRWKNEDF